MADEGLDGGKIVPLESRRSGKADLEEVKGKAVPLPLKPRSNRSLDWDAGYYPVSLKQYYREMLIAYKNKESIGNQVLRDRIMVPEDEKLADQNGNQKSQRSQKKVRDTRLTLDDLKKWLSPNAIHQIGDPKFAFINRYIQTLLALGELEVIEAQYSEERKAFHQQALRDIFSFGYESERYLKQFDDYANHSLLSSQAGNVRLPTALLFIDGFSLGITPVTVLFSSMEFPQSARVSQAPDDRLKDFCAGRFPLVMRGYLILTAKHPSGEPPMNPFIEGKLLLTRDDVDVLFLNDLRHARFISTVLVAVSKNDDGAITDYAITVDASDFPTDTAASDKTPAMEREGDQAERSPARLSFRFFEGGPEVEKLRRKFSGVYTT